MALAKSIFETFVRKAAKDKTAGRGVAAMVAGLVATRIATRSVPGALLVGGALVAKHFWDKSKENDPTITTVEDKIARDPELAAELARDNPELLTDAADDKDRAEAIGEKTGKKPKVVASA